MNELKTLLDTHKQKLTLAFETKDKINHVYEIELVKIRDEYYVRKVKWDSVIVLFLSKDFDKALSKFKEIISGNA